MRPVPYLTYLGKFPTSKASLRAVAKGTVVLFTSISSVIAFIPTGVLLRRMGWLPYLGICSAIVGALTVREFRLTTTRMPNIYEGLLALVAAIFPPAIASSLCIILYWITNALSYAVFTVFRTVGWRFALAPARAAFYITLIAAPLFGTMMVNVAASAIFRQLFPATAGLKSPFYSLIATRRPTLVVFVIVTAGAGFALSFLVHSVTWFYVRTSAYLVLASGWLWVFGEKSSRPSSYQNVESSIAKLLEALGFSVVLSPRTGDERIDPLLTDIDILALRGRKAFAIHVKQGNKGSQPLDWTDASRVELAAWALRASLQASDPDRQVDPVILLVGSPEGATLPRSRVAEQVRLLQMPKPEMMVAEIQDPVRCRIQAERVFGSLLEAADHSMVGGQSRSSSPSDFGPVGAAS
jgi:hypothetical protein